MSDEWSGNLPDWFKEKYSDKLLFPSRSMIASAIEFKLYGGTDLFKDYQLALIEAGSLNNGVTATVVVLAEDGVITKVEINSAEITYTNMKEGDFVFNAGDQGY